MFLFSFYFLPYLVRILVVFSYSLCRLVLKILPLGGAKLDTTSDTPDEAQHRKRRPGTKS